MRDPNLIARAPTRYEREKMQQRRSRAWRLAVDALSIAFAAAVFAYAWWG